jgi:ubiquinone/menaquinone biosynthesis C-methylase UbiE
MSSSHGQTNDTSTPSPETSQDWATNSALRGLKEGDVVLDLASGPGIGLLHAARRVGRTGKAIGVDMTDEMILQATTNAQAAGLCNVEVRRGIIEELPVENASVDWVISNCAINLSPEKGRVFREIARVLRPGGQVVVSDLMAAQLPPWAREDAALFATCIAGAMTEEEFVQGLQDAGLSDVKIEARLVYEKGQIASFVSEAVQGIGGQDRLSPHHAEYVAEALAGKVWSARVRARRPLPSETGDECRGGESQSDQPKGR